MSRLLVTVVVVLLAGCSAAGCRKVVSNQVLDRTVERTLFDISGERVHATCPAGRTMITGNDFFCRTEVFGRRGWVLVVQQDRYGRIELQRTDPVNHDIVEGFVREFLASQFDVRNARVTCPHDVVPEPDHNFSCRVAGHPSVLVRQVDGAKDYTFQYRGSDSQGHAR